MKKLHFVLIAILLLSYSCTKNTKTKLVVYIVSDQLTPNLMIKYDSLFTGGFRWLKDNGVDYRSTFHNHGKTNTGNGHFALSTGVHPGKGGIISNDWYDRDLKKAVNVVEDTSSTNFSGNDIGRSYKNIQSTSLADWLKDTYTNSKVVSVSGKDRGSILMAGSDPDLALWYDKDGGYTSSTFYLPALPLWVKDFNRKLNVRSYKDSIWSRLKNPDIYTKYARPDDFAGEKIVSKKKGAKPTLPLAFGEMSESSLLSGFYEYPQGDRSLIDLAIKTIDRFKMGEDSSPDILFLGLSATDGVGHHFGPNSVEQLDNYLRSDKNLKRLINYIQRKVGAGNTLYILTGDHGAMDLPEYLLSKNISSGRISGEQRKKIYAKIISQIDSKIGSKKVKQYGDAFYFDKDLTKDEKDIAVTIIKDLVLQIDGVERALTAKEIIELPKSKINIRLKNMIHPTKSPNVFVLIKENWLWKDDYGSSHGTHYDYDSHVPFIVSRFNNIPRVENKNLFTVDIPVTIAKYLKLDYPNELDGNPIPLKFIEK